MYCLCWSWTGEKLKSLKLFWAELRVGLSFMKELELDSIKIEKRVSETILSVAGVRRNDSFIKELGV